MGKVSGLGSSFLFGIYDLSGDIGAIGNITATQAFQDVSSIAVSGTERITLRQDGSIGYSSFWNDAAPIVPILADLDGGHAQVTVIKGPGGLGANAASLRALRANFVTANGQDGSLGATGEVQGSLGNPVEWGRVLTVGKQTFAATQAISSWVVNHAYSLNDLVVPTSANGHYYKATTGGTSHAATEPTWPTNGTTVADNTVVWTDQGLLPNGIDRGVGSASDHGCAAYLHAISIGSGSATIKVQDSADRIAWADVPLAAFSAVTTPVTQRVETATTENVKRYVRVNVTGSFTNLVAAVSVVVYRIATI